LVNILDNSFNFKKNIVSPLKPKLKAILEGDEVQPNISLVCNLGSVLTTLKKINGMNIEKYNYIVLAYRDSGNNYE